MKLPRRNFLHLAAAAAALPALSRIARAQTYPTRPVTIIVPVPPGGVADPIARILADYLTVTLGQPVVVENVTGAGGSIGGTRVDNQNGPELRARDQPEDRQGARPRNPAQAARARRRGDRMM